MSFLEKNRKVLEERFGSLDELFQVEDNPHWVTGQSREEVPWATWKGLSLCSRHAPLKEADRLVSQNSGTYNTLCLFGFGMGYTAEAWIRQNPDGKIILLECSRSLFVEALKSRDLTWLLGQKGLYLMVESSAEPFTALLKDLQLTACQVIRHRVLYRHFEQDYLPLEEALGRWLNRKEVNRNTLRRFGTLWVRNFAANLGLLNEARSLSSLAGRFRGLPVVVTGAGPGMDYQLPIIKEAQGRILIIAVDTAYRTLKRWGIKPHFLLITDPQYWNSRHLDFCESNEILISDSSTHPRVFRQHKGPVYLSTSPFPLAAPFEEGKFDHKLRSGGSVATAAWDLALHLGCSPVYLAGLDLSYPGQQSHCRGSYFEERSLFLANRLSGVEQHSWQGIHSAPTLLRPSQTEGKLVLSDQRMSVYLDWFSENAPGTESRNLSKEGAKIQGMTQADPLELLSYPDIESLLEETLEQISQENQHHHSWNPTLVLNSTLESLERCFETSRRGMELSKSLSENFYKGLDLQPILEELNVIDQKLHQLTAREIGGFLMEPFLEEILSRQEEKEPEIILQNTLEIYQEMNHAVGYHLKVLKGATFPKK